ncbi:MAG: hypothetical protein JW769_04380 [Parachlamydiales bacterium]|nr:hypothetical protein [Parachlamydiales bacterium]
MPRIEPTKRETVPSKPVVSEQKMESLKRSAEKVKPLSSHLPKGEITSQRHIFAKNPMVNPLIQELFFNKLPL